MKKSILGTLVGSLCWGISVAQKNIPASVLPILREAEVHRLHFKHDSAFYSVRQAQRAYYQLNQPAEAARLYPRLFLLSLELTRKPFIDSFDVCLKEIEQIAKRQPEFKKDYLFSKFVYLDSDQAELKQAVFKELISVTDLNKDWDYRILPTALMFNNTDSAYDSTLGVAHQLMEKYLPLATFKNAYLHSASSEFAFYVPYDMANYQLYEKRDYEQALHYFNEVTTRIESAYILDSLWYSTAFNSISRIYKMKGDLSKMRDYMEKAISYIPAHISHAHNNYNNHISVSYLLEDNYKQAIKSALIARQWDNTPNKSPNGVHDLDDFCWTLANLIEAYTRSHRLHEAGLYVDTLLSLPNVTKIRKDEKATQYDVYQSLGLFNWKQGNINDARRYFDLAAKLYDKIPAEITLSLSELELEQGQPLLALDYIQQYLQRQAHYFTPKQATENPTISQIIYPFLALKGFQHKLKIWHKLYIADKPFDAKATKVYYETAVLGIDLLQKTCRELERENAKSSLVSISFQIYEHAIYAAYLIYTHQDKAYLDNIFTHIEQSKAFLLSSSLQESTARSFGGVPDSLIALEKELGINIQFYTQQQQDAQQRQQTPQAHLYGQYAFQFKQRLDSLKQRLERDYPRYYELKYNQQTATIADIQQQLDSRTALLSYFEGYDYLFVFEIEQHTANVRCIARPSEYDKLVRNFRAALTSPSLQSENAVKSFVEMASQLHKWFIPNTLPDGIDRLLIIPDGSLNYVPFETFISDNNTSINDFQQLNYLIKKYNVSYHYSASLWQRQRQDNKRPVNRQILAMAASYEKMSDKDLEKLPEQLRNVRKTLAPLVGTVQEIDFLKRNFEGLYLINQDATEANFKQNADKYGIVHLAMHGLVDELHPEYSSLAFTDAAESEDDNFLQAYEIKALTMNADLVVLSACETGYGKFSRGEGVISLGRGFMFNGTASLLMTLWAINDQTTPIIVEQFYQNLSKGLPKDEALRQAKLYYLSQYSGASAHPAFWAAFVQVGKVDNIQPATPTNWTLWASLAGGSLAIIGFWTWWKRRAA